LIFFASLLLKTSLILSVSRSFHKEQSKANPLLITVEHL
jgi:hypothetical protein